MRTKYLRIAKHDGNGNIAVPAGPPASWVPGTILEVYPESHLGKFEWGDRANFLLIRASSNMTLDEWEIFHADVNERKKMISTTMFLSSTTLDRYRTNRTNYYLPFLEDQKPILIRLELELMAKKGLLTKGAFERARLKSMEEVTALLVPIERMYKDQFFSNGEQVRFNRIVNIDTPSMLADTPAWQHPVDLG